MHEYDTPSPDPARPPRPPRMAAVPKPSAAPPAPGLGPAAVLAMQRGAGNAAVQRYFSGKPYIDHGPLSDGCGTWMRAELHPGKLEDGSVPSVRPPWWDNITGGLKKYFSRFVVQGHLLNHNVGGTGKEMKNLTPITKGANSQHLKKVEKHVKSRVQSEGKVVEYLVYADYGSHPTGKGYRLKGAQSKKFNDDFAPMMAGKLVAEYTVYTKKGKDLGGDRWEIWNER